MSAIKVIKRDGTIVDYDRSKIKLAIQRQRRGPGGGPHPGGAHRLHHRQHRGPQAQRLLVEDIQDMVEQALVAENKFLLAKTYIIYRYTRAGP